MKLHVKSYRGITQAELNITPLTLVAGDNGQGKSAIAGALGALLTGDPLPSWCKKKDVADFINDDAETEASKIELITEEGSASVVYPTAKFSTTGTPPHASRVAAGLDSPLDMSDKEKSKYFSELLGTEPTKKQLASAVADAGLPDEHVDKLWEKIQITGWDAAHNEAEKRGAEVKGSWKHVTGGEAYGSKKAADWTPEGWVPRLEGLDLDVINTQVVTVQKERDSAIRATARDEGETARLQQLADGLDVATATHKDNFTLVGMRTKELDVAMKAAPAILSADDQDCPWCNQPLSIKNGKVTRGGGVTEKQVAASVTKHAAGQKKIKTAEGKLVAARDDSIKSSALVKDCEVARDVLAKFVTPDVGGRTPEDIDAEIAGLQADRRMIIARNDAKKYHHQVEKNAVIVGALSPDGLRKDVLEVGLDVFNARMLGVCESACWPAVAISPDLSFTFGGRDYRLISTSQQYRVRKTVQLAAAWRDHSEVVVIDAAEVLMRSGRNGLITAVMELGVPAVVVMSYPEREGVPDMSKIGGETVWVEDGEVVE